MRSGPARSSGGDSAGSAAQAQVLSPVGDHLRVWRQRRRMSQLDLALDARISQRHLSFVESGRSSPSRDMVMTLAERLELPLRERNVLLQAAGYAPVFPERSLDDPALKPARAAVDLVLKGHEPFPALAVDRHWTLVAANAAVAPFLAGVLDAALTNPPVNVLRLSLHPQGLAHRIANLAEWRGHVLERLRHQIDVTGDAILARLLRELSGYPETNALAPVAQRAPAPDYAGVVVPLRLVTDGGTLSFFDHHGVRDPRRRHPVGTRHRGLLPRG